MIPLCEVLVFLARKKSCICEYLYMHLFCELVAYGVCVSSLAVCAS